MNKEINILYKFNEANTDSKAESSNYQILQVFTELGPLANKTLSSVYREFSQPGLGSPASMHFASLEELGRFVIEVLKESGSPEAFLLSTEDYNIGLDSCNDSEQFQDIFRRYGTSLENPESSIKKRSLFGNLFNK